MPDRILVVEDEETLRKNLGRYLEQQGYQVCCSGSAEEAVEEVARQDFDVALVDIRLPGRDGLSLAGDLSARDVAIVVMTAYSSVESVIDALHSGVHDYLVKPLLLKDVGVKLARVCEHRRLARENARLRRILGSRGEEQGPIARSRVMLDLLAFVRQVAASTSTVLIEGESGSGKEVVARALHDSSPRREGPFVAVNMTAIPDTLVESQLFGHEKGAFTGADSAREGLFRAASFGTLFLDEIGELSMPNQAKLLRALEGKEIIPVGGSRSVKVDTRVVAATNADLGKLVSEKRFRSDLYYRLGAIRVKVPPLRERPEDIPALAQHFLARHTSEHKRAIAGFDSAAVRKLLTYGWPGNVRELSNVVERSVVVCTGSTIGVADLPPEVTGTAAEDAGYVESMADFERALLRSTLERVGGDRREAARLLGLSLATLYRRIEKLGLKEREAETAPDSEVG
ncbi:MAG: sigma-54-dependent Fis family transcriptional regulator [Myxococcales bacterium]|nr:sigma-54-dependent Fis family transcriptional regulator [Myxococcales bacterium]